MPDFSQFFSSSPWGSWGGAGGAQPPVPQPQADITPALLAALRKHLGIDDDAQSMTHQAEAPNPAAPAVEFGKQVGKHFLDKVASAVTAPRDALTGALQVTDPETGMPTREAMERGQGVANLAMTGGLPFAKGGAAGMAGGKLVQPAGDKFAIPSPLEQLRSHYDEAAKDLGTTQVPISDLVRRSGLSQDAVHKHLLNASKQGEANLYSSTVPLGELPKATAAAAIHHPAWDEPLVDVEFSRKPSPPAFHYQDKGN